MKEEKKTEYPEKTPKDELQKTVTNSSPKIQDPNGTRTLTLALVAGHESRRANHYTIRHLSPMLECKFKPGQPSRWPSGKASAPRAGATEMGPQ